jgi:transposase
MFQIAEVDGTPAAFLIALREGLEDYTSENYIWFSKQYEQFLYVDRIVIDEKFRGCGLGRRIYDGEISRYQAAEIYDISEQTARDYMRLYRDSEQLPPKRAAKNTIKAPSFQTGPAGMEELESMTKEQLIQELVKARITEARLKKGYEVKGDGTVILYGNGNTK